MKALESFFDEVTEEELSVLIGKVPRPGGRTPKSIIDLTLGKAEIKMKKHSGNKRNRTVLIALIAAAVVGTVGAAATAGLFHKDNVEHYLGEGSGEQLESMDAVNNTTAENAHYRVTLDTFLSDGHYGIAVFTAQGLDDIGKTYADRFMETDVVALDPQSREITDLVDGTYSRSMEGDTDDQSCFVVSFNMDDREPGTEVLIAFDDSMIQLEDAMILRGEEPDINTLTNYAAGIEIPLTLENNIEAVTAKSADGGEVLLSRIELYSPDSFYNEVESLHAIADDGTRTEIALEATSGANPENIAPGWQIRFAEILDLKELRGVEVNGVDYMIE